MTGLKETSIELPTGGVYSLVFGFRELEARHHEARWTLRITATDPPNIGKPPEVRRLLTGRSVDRLTLSLLGPELPLVVTFVTPLTLVGGATKVLRFNLPIALRLAVDGSDNAELYDAMGRMVSRTWYGVPESGEVGLHYPVDVNPDGTAPPAAESDLALAQITVHNKSAAPITIDKLCLRMMHSAVYLAGERLHYSPVGITYKSAADPAQVTYGDVPPEVAGAIRHSAPRTPSSGALALLAKGNFSFSER